MMDGCASDGVLGTYTKRIMGCSLITLCACGSFINAANQANSPRHSRLESNCSCDHRLLPIITIPTVTGIRITYFREHAHLYNDQRPIHYVLVHVWSFAFCSLASWDAL